MRERVTHVREGRRLRSLCERDRLESGLAKQGLLDLANRRASIAADVAPSVLRELYYEGARHGAVETVPLWQTPGLAEFLSAQKSGSASWSSVRP